MTVEKATTRIRQGNIGALVLLAIGSLQFLGTIVCCPPIKGLGCLSVAAPFPKVFCDVDGIETFAAEFTLLYELPGQGQQQLKITPEVYSLLKGPYNRRNIYGAALSYGPTPKFPEDLFRAVFTYGLVKPGALKKDIGIPDEATHMRVHVKSLTKGRSDEWILPEQTDRAE